MKGHCQRRKRSKSELLAHGLDLLHGCDVAFSVSVLSSPTFDSSSLPQHVQAFGASVCLPLEGRTHVPSFGSAYRSVNPFTSIAPIARRAPLSPRAPTHSRRDCVADE